MATRPHADGRHAEVWARLDTVTDPELDEALTDLGFIEAVEIASDGAVDVTFRLPTYWCSANFAFLMAEDIRRSVEALPWVTRVRPHLQDHMVAEAVNGGVRDGLSFGEVFARYEATGTLDELRETFRRKAFERRQEAVMLALRAGGATPAALCRMTLGELDRSDLSRHPGEPPARYRALLVEKGLATLPDDLAFRSYSGRAIRPDELAGYLHRLRAVRINMEFNSGLCRGLLEARYKVLDPTTGLLTREGAGCGSGCGSGCASTHGPAARDTAAAAAT